MVRVLKFSSAGCGPCRMMGPIMEQFKQRNPGVIVEEYDVGVTGDFGYGVTAVPTLVILKDDQPVNRLVGIASLSMIEAATKV
jgi:thioredoxin 1